MLARAALIGALAFLLVTPDVPAQPAARPGPQRFLSWNLRTRVAHLVLLAGLGGENNGFNFDGYGRGELLVTIPVGWRVVVDCENRGRTRHSCAIVAGSLATRPAFRGAATPAPRSRPRARRTGDVLVQGDAARLVPHRLPRPRP